MTIIHIEPPIGAVLDTTIQFQGSKRRSVQLTMQSFLQAGFQILKDLERSLRGDGSKEYDREDVPYYSFFGYSLVMLFGGLLWGLICFQQGLTEASILPWSYSAITGILIIAAARQKLWFVWIGPMQLALGLLFPFVLQWKLGGWVESGATMLWSLSTVIGSLLIVKAWASFAYLAGFVALVMASLIAQGSGWEMQTPPSIGASYLLAINVTGTLSMIYLVCKIFFERSKDYNQLLKENLNTVKSESEAAYQKALSTQKLASLGEITAGIGHEINNPLSISTINLDRIQSLLDSKSQTELNSHLEKIRSANRRIAAIVRELRVFAREENATPEWISLKEDLSQTASFLQDLFVRENVILNFDYTGPEVSAKATAGKIQQIVINLAINGRDATEGKPSRVVDITCEAHPDKAILKIKDNGSGIPEEVQARLFEPFFTTKESGKGTGIGMGLVQKFVAEVDGQIRFNSLEQVGTEFCIEIPCVENSKLKNEDENNIIDLEAQADSHSGKRILIVDDEDDLREVVAQILEMKGYEVTQASDAQVAADTIVEQDFDFIMADLNMPKISGIKLFVWSNKLEKSHKFVLITGQTDIDIAQDPRLKDVDGFLYKPFEVNQLLKLLKQLEAAPAKAA